MVSILTHSKTLEPPQRPLATKPAAAGEAVLARVDGVAGGDGGDRGIDVAAASSGHVFFCASRSAPVGRSVADASTCPLRIPT